MYHFCILSQGIQKKVLVGPTELELETVVSCHAGDGSQSWGFGKSKKCF